MKQPKICIIFFTLICLCFLPQYSRGFNESCNLVEIYDERKILFSEFMELGNELFILEENKLKMIQIGKDTIAIDNEIEGKNIEMDSIGVRISELLNIETSKIKFMFDKRFELEEVYNNSDDTQQKENISREIGKLDECLKGFFNEVKMNRSKYTDN